MILKQPVPEEIQYSFEPVRVVYEDEWCLVADKPSFLLVHDDGQSPDNLTARVNAHLSETGWPYAVQAVNRIDREASGLVLFCKNPCSRTGSTGRWKNGQPARNTMRCWKDCWSAGMWI